MRRHTLAVASTLGVFIAGTLLFAQSQEGPDPAMQGSWTVIGAQHEGRPMDGLNGGVMTVTQERFEIRTASGSTLKGELKLNRAKTPPEMDLVHDNGLHWEAVYTVEGDDFKLNYVPAGGKDKRPAAFKTSTDTEASLVIMKRKK